MYVQSQTPINVQVKITFGFAIRPDVEVRDEFY